MIVSSGLLAKHFLLWFPRNGNGYDLHTEEKKLYDAV